MLRVSPRPPGGYVIDEVALTAGSDVIALNEVAYTSDKYQNLNPIHDRLLAGPAAGPFALIAGCAGSFCLRAGAPAGFVFAADGSRLAYAGETWRDPPIVVRDLATGAVHSVRPPRPPGSAPSDRTVSRVRLAGDFLAWQREAGGRAIVVVNLASGRVVQEIGAPTGFSPSTVGSWDLQADGKLVASGSDRLAWFAPGDARPNVIGLGASGAPVIAGDRILYRRRVDGALVLADLQGAQRVISRRGGGIRFVGDLAFDGRRAAWAQLRCRTLTITRSDDVLAERPAALPRRTDCGRPRVAGRLALSRDGTRLIVRLACSAGCRGEIQVTGAGKRRFALRPSARAQPLALRLSPSAQRRIARRRGRRVSIQVTVRAARAVYVISTSARL